MRAVWSYWSKPMGDGAISPWLAPRFHWLSWILSVETARRHYPEVALVTDSAGARVLVDEIGLTFTHVSTELDALAEVDPRWWVMGKLHAYRAEERPFVHIDSDVYLWSRLPASLEQAPLLAQSPDFIEDMDYYEPERLLRLLDAHRGYVPEAWRFYLTQPDPQAACCGIFGGNAVDFIRAYADTAIRTVRAPNNQAAWAEAGDIPRQCVLAEQYLLTACLAHRRAMDPAEGRRLYLQYLFPDGDVGRAKEAGYTHLIANAKRHRDVLDRLEKVVRRDHPTLYRRCLAYLEKVERPGEARGDPPAELHG